jgi:UDP-N-acetylglucosamine/UDP-N-acetylgalactosamine diphosphorylase
MPAEMAAERDPDGALTFRAGSPAIHLFSVEFLDRVTSGETRLPFHVARKKVPYYDPVSRAAVEPKAENALKFERFVFDALPLADRWLAVEVTREDEFAPLKNATGADSPATVTAAMVNQAGRWLAAAGVPTPNGVPVEISPLYALDPAALAERVDKDIVIVGPTYFQ